VDRDRLAALCLALPELRLQAAAHGASDRLEALITAARETGVVSDEIFEQAADWQVGIDLAADTDRSVRGLPLPPWQPFVQMYGCPGGHCARRWVRRPGVPAPWCDVHAAALEKRS
jgi:hypothetical protein